MNRFLTREDAPIEAKTWEVLDKAMLEAAKNVLAGRRILVVEGPYGLGLKAVPLSDPEVQSGPITSPMMPLALITRGFTMAKRDLAAFEKDGITLDVRSANTAATECSRLEDEVIFKGTKEAAGLLSAKGSNQLKLTAWTEIGAAAEDIIKAVTVLDDAGYHGPYSLALAPDRYNQILRMYPNGNISELEHMKTIATEGVIKAPIMESGGVLLAAGRQYASMVLGQDMAVGYIGPVSERLEFSISVTLTPYIRHAKAICILKE